MKIRRGKPNTRDIHIATKIVTSYIPLDSYEQIQSFSNQQNIYLSECIRNIIYSQIYSRKELNVPTASR